MLAFLMSCRTSPSSQHWSSKLCKGPRRHCFPLLITSPGMLPLPSAFPDAGLSMAFDSSSMDGGSSSWSNVGRCSMEFRASRHTVFSFKYSLE